MKGNFIKSLALFATLLFSPLIQAAPVWIDVRSEAEYKADHIDGDALIPHTNIVQSISKLYADKNTEIHLYCRSGRRAGIALNALKEAGYTNVKNMGGISDARQERGL